MTSKRLRSILTAIAALACASPMQTHAKRAPDLAIDQNASGSTVALCRGQRLIVHLHGNPTTGFVWKRAPGAESLLAQQGEPQFTPDTGKLGAGGTYSFILKATGEGRAPLKFIYLRPFDQDAAPARTFEATIEVAK